MAIGPFVFELIVKDRVVFSEKGGDKTPSFYNAFNNIFNSMDRKLL